MTADFHPKVSCLSSQNKNGESVAGHPATLSRSYPISRLSASSSLARARFSMRDTYDREMP